VREVFGEVAARGAGDQAPREAAGEPAPAGVL
jgi:hypothetical protein